MDAPQVSNKMTAFVFGALYNLLTIQVDESLVGFTVKQIIGATVWLVAQVIADRIKRRGEKKSAEVEQQNKN